MPEGDTIILPGDEVFCLAATVHIRQVMRELRRSDKPMRRIMIAGGGNIGFRLAQSIEENHHVKILELNRTRAEMLASHLSNALVLRGDSTDEKLLETEGIDETDLFVALTNDEEDNIMSASLAKRMGARRTLALINRKSYVDLVQGGPIDIAISPAHTSIGTACPRAPRRRGRGAQPAPRRRRGPGDHRPRQQQGLQGGRAPDRADRPAAWREHRRHRARREERGGQGGPPRGDHPAPRHGDPRG
jgi:Trk K+ transport system NAD-binding subunit